ncbi:protein serine/threonine phosphatase 2C [Calocera viscosa TUFC12733]|uniref:Protein serine/threonine phosphatase 2C n=1 Tax=Calocera viscosa (strain TUFC12733) TaxID=1330018 RepID=A0A167FQ94_CALVF|nr:protein serine/threonine phosphatase 2C [Calocera viscosa TUFC12733]
MNLSAFSKVYAHELDLPKLHASWISFQPADHADISGTSPTNADRVFVGNTDNGFVLILVIDGHGGYECAEYVRQQLSARVMKYLKGCHPPSKLDDLQPLCRQLQDIIRLLDEEVISDLTNKLPSSYEMPQDKSTLEDKFRDEESVAVLKRAVQGAVLSLVVLSPCKSFGLALNLGDCHVVLYTPPAEQHRSRRVQVLGHHHDTQNADELKRLCNGQSIDPVREGRLHGIAEFTRAMGDALLKVPLPQPVRQIIGDILEDCYRPGLYPSMATNIGRADVSNELIAVAESRIFPLPTGLTNPLVKSTINQTKEVYLSWYDWIGSSEEGLPAARLLYENFDRSPDAVVSKYGKGRMRMDDITVVVADVTN